MEKVLNPECINVNTWFARCHHWRKMNKGDTDSLYDVLQLYVNLQLSKTES